MSYKKKKKQNKDVLANIPVDEKEVEEVSSFKTKSRFDGSQISIGDITPDIRLPMRSEEEVIQSKKSKKDFERLERAIKESVQNNNKNNNKNNGNNSGKKTIETPKVEEQPKVEAETLTFTENPVIEEFFRKERNNKNNKKNKNKKGNHDTINREVIDRVPDVVVEKEISRREDAYSYTPHNRKNTKKLKVISLGGLGEIGKNITVLEYSDNIIIVDCGLGFPDNDMFGVDTVIPDYTYLINNREKIKGLIVTHGHEDHIGGIPYLLQKLDIPVYGTKLTLGILQIKFKDFKFTTKPRLNEISAGEHINLGVFDVEAIRVNHSIADSVCFAINTPVGMVIHTGDFKIDSTPIHGDMTDLTRLGEIGKNGVELLLCESTNIERAGYTPSEKMVGIAFDKYFEEYKDKRIIISTFSSNVHRVQQIVDISVARGRKVAITGKSMQNVIEAAIKLGYMIVPEGTFIDVAMVNKYPPEKITIISTGSQGERMSGLYRMAYGLHDKVDLTPHDLVIISATAIPGNEKLVGNIINELYKRGVKVLTDQLAAVHVSGHACQEEIKIIHSLLKPKYFMPIHGETRHVYVHKEIAEWMGMEPSNIFVTSEIGRILEIGAEGARFNGTVPAGVTMIDGSGIGDVGNVVLRDRQALAQDGVIGISIIVDEYESRVKTLPEVSTRGFVYEKESLDLIDKIKEIAYDAADEALRRNPSDLNGVRGKVRDDVQKYVASKTKRKPSVITMVTRA